MGNSGFTRKVTPLRKEDPEPDNNMNDKSIFSKTFEISVIIVLTAIAILIAGFGISVGLTYQATKDDMNAKFEQINNSINKNAELMNQRFDYYEKYSDQKIENEVNKKILEQKR